MLRTLDDMLGASVWARDLTPSDIARIKAGISVRTIAAGDAVCMKGERVEHWMGVIDGLVKMTSNDISGKTTTFTGVATGGWFGEGSLLKDEPRRYDVVALRDSRIAFMNRSIFQSLLDSSIAFNRFLIVQLNERLGQFIGLMEHERLLDVEARLARGLASMFNPVLYPGIGPRLQISQEELGFLAGVSRQRVNRALHALAEAKLLRVDYGGITVLDLPRLRSYGS
ncbi:cyclic nucleotide-binding domain-containing protein [Rhodocyclus tenuis]|uniref:Crp/Fnr family transcriptional regulator n=1 Tax=Rhodocyclus gracilis TaxID=2929842 RepID=UPI001298DEBE|nr:Crp/Fnr family transcriptional regulator [Rhodocyclus gracilis]MRD73364.1 cyclic nucleotide-binding domain-containing protein [Rhodocyclus gracilis]